MPSGAARGQRPPSGPSRPCSRWRGRRRSPSGRRSSPAPPAEPITVWPLSLGDLADHRAHRARGAGDEDHVAVLQRRDPQQAGIGGQARHAGRAQEGLGRQAQGVELLHRGGRGVEALAPAEAATAPGRRASGRVVGGDDLADRAAVHGLAELRRAARSSARRSCGRACRDRRSSRGSAPAPRPAPGAGSSTLASSKLSCGGQARRAALQADFARRWSWAFLLGPASCVQTAV